MTSWDIVLLIVLIYPLTILVCSWIEKRQWNSGTCSSCDTYWEYHDTDSQGGRMYKCDNDHVIWVSYGHDRPLLVMKRDRAENHDCF